MNVLTWLRRLAVVCAAVAPGCGLDEIGAGIGCGLADGLQGLADGLNLAFGGGTDNVQDDDGQFAGEAYCGGDDCARRDVLRGSTMNLALELLHLDRDFAEEVASDSEIVSTAPDVVAIEGFEPQADSCGNVAAVGELRFASVGEGAVEVQRAGRAAMRLTFRVHEADSLRIDAVGLSLEAGLERDGDVVRAMPGDFLQIETNVRNADGVQLSTGGQAHFWVDDPEVADLAGFEGNLRTAVDGPKQLLALKARGTTRVHALVANLKASLTVEVGEGGAAGGAGSGGAGDEDAGTEGEQP